MKIVIFADVKSQKIITLALLLLTSLSLSGQEKQPSWLVRTTRNILTGVSTPKKHFDSTYVFQTKLVWTVALEAEWLRPGADLFGDYSADAPLWDSFSIQDGSLKVGLVDQPCHKLGLAVGYGTLRLGYGIQVGRREGERNTYFSFGLHSAAYSAQIRYYRLHPHPTGTIDFGGSFPVSLTSAVPGEIRALTLDGSYAFNRHRFVYNAAYTGRHLQRRSAGSWMVTAKYLQGDFSLNPDETAVLGLSGPVRIDTRQFSAGGGYSFNWTLFHRDPAEEENKGLRNLTFNATALPMVSFVSLVRTVGGDSDGQTVRYKNMPTFTPAVRSAICYSLDRWSISVETAYSRYDFRGVEKDFFLPASDQPVHVKARGVFHDLTVKGKVNLHF